MSEYKTAIGDVLFCILACLLFIGFGMAIGWGITANTETYKIAERVSHAIRECEYELPRNEHCTIIGIKKPSNVDDPGHYLDNPDAFLKYLDSGDDWFALESAEVEE